MSLERALLSLEGLSVGDAFGETFLRHPGDEVADRLRRRAPFPAPWPWTDDSQMAIAVVEILAEHGQIEQEALARRLAARYEPHRGYGAGAHQILRELRRGRSWESAARALFGGDGSLGNGAAMRVAPLGAFFAEDLDRAAEEAARSAEVTHAHAEGAAGAIAVALASALACVSQGRPLDPVVFLRTIEGRVPPGPTRDGIADASRLSASIGVSDAARVLGNGSRVTAPDTVPFCLWAAARHADGFADALWNTARGLGDIDTNCAIVGGVLAVRLGLAAIPVAWRKAREPLPRIGGAPGGT